MMTQSPGAVEYTNCTSAEGYDPRTSVLGCLKQSGGKNLVMLELWGMRSTPL